MNKDLRVKVSKEFEDYILLRLEKIKENVYLEITGRSIREKMRITKQVYNKEKEEAPAYKHILIKNN